MTFTNHTATCVQGKGGPKQTVIRDNASSSARATTTACARKKNSTCACFSTPLALELDFSHSWFLGRHAQLAHEKGKALKYVCKCQCQHRLSSGKPLFKPCSFALSCVGHEHPLLGVCSNTRTRRAKMQTLSLKWALQSFFHCRKIPVVHHAHKKKKNVKLFRTHTRDHPKLFSAKALSPQLCQGHTVEHLFSLWSQKRTANSRWQSGGC